MRPHIAAVLHLQLHRFFGRWRRGQGWVEDVIGYTGYGAPPESGDVVRVLGRVVFTEPSRVGRGAADATATEAELSDAQDRRGWRSFVATPAVYTPVTVTAGAASRRTTTDWSGYVDVELRGHGLTPGWHEATIASDDGAAMPTDVLVFDPAAKVGIVSDIDDTVLVTFLPRPLVAAWNTFMRSETAREPVPGMAQLAAWVLRRFPDAPVIYLSTGAWNVAPTLVRFLRRHGFPAGPLLLTDWGPTNTGWFRSGRAHKRQTLERLHREFPDVAWILVGDDGQHDPGIYRDFARRHPEAVRAIAIRTLTTAEQVFSHGFPGPKEPTDDLSEPEVPVLYAKDGHALRVVLDEYDVHRYGPDGPTVVDDVPVALGRHTGSDPTEAT